MLSTLRKTPFVLSVFVQLLLISQCVNVSGVPVPSSKARGKKIDITSQILDRPSTPPNLGINHGDIKKVPSTAYLDDKDKGKASTQGKEHAGVVVGGPSKSNNYLVSMVSTSGLREGHGPNDKGPANKYHDQLKGEISYKPVRVHGNNLQDTFNKDFPKLEPSKLTDLKKEVNRVTPNPPGTPPGSPKLGPSGPTRPAPNVRPASPPPVNAWNKGAPKIAPPRPATPPPAPKPAAPKPQPAVPAPNTKPAAAGGAWGKGGPKIAGPSKPAAPPPAPKPAAPAPKPAAPKPQPAGPAPNTKPAPAAGAWAKGAPKPAAPARPATPPPAPRPASPAPKPASPPPSRAASPQPKKK